MFIQELFPLFSRINLDWFRVDTWFVIAMVIALIAFIAVSVIWGIRAHHRRVTAGREDLVGKVAEVKTALNSKGTVLIEGELWSAISEGGEVQRGAEVVITRIDRLKVWVAKKQAARRCNSLAWWKGKIPFVMAKFSAIISGGYSFEEAHV